AGFSGKVSPVHHFWHTFDIAHTRFADRRVDQSPQVDRVTREAYSREVISFGFWFGDEQFTEPAFYSYTAPEPTGLVDEPRRPRSGFRSAAATWRSSGTSRRGPSRTRAPRCSTSTKARTRRAPGWPAGTSPGLPARVASPIRVSGDRRAE